MKYQLSVEQFKKSKMFDSRGKLYHKPGNRFKLFPFTGNTSANIVLELEPLIGSFLCMIEEKSPQKITVAELVEKLKQDIEIQSGQEEFFGDMIRKLFFTENGTVRAVNLQMIEQISCTETNEKKMVEYLVDVLGDSNLLRKELSDAKLKLSSNILETEIISKLKFENQVNSGERLKYFRIVESLHAFFEEDFAYILEDQKCLREYLVELLELYYFSYTAQTILQLGRFMDGERNNNIPLYFCLEWEKTSQSRLCFTEGWRKLQNAIEKIFAHAITLEILNQTEINSEIVDYIRLNEIVDSDEKDKEIIARQALESYKKVFGNSKKLAFLSGKPKEYDADILFATMSKMAKPETLESYKPEEFDWICIDEVHRAGAESYQRIMKYFQPQFWLGMTASPERTDGFDIFNLFDHNIAYEIRLQHALKEDLLCPFHYFGITDIEIDGQTVDDKTDLRNFSYLVSDVRVRYILEQANYFGYSGERVKGLIFCRGKDEARELSTKFNECGYYTSVLTGAASEKEREQAINLLTKEISEDEIEKHEKNICNHVKNDTDEMPFLDYIFTIDIFNEGVDIPEINQVLMLRPTESPIIFVQQLGRGLRKAEGKEYVVIIDFIGNYTNNYMIPIALSGDRSYNKDSIRRYVSEGTRIIPGASTIHFDEISRKRIFQSIDSARTNDVKLLREAFEQLKYRLGRIPTVLDFREYGSIDVNKYFSKFGSYYAFLIKYYSKEYEVRLTSEEENIIEFLSKKVTNMKRIHELALLHQLLKQQRRLFTYYKKILETIYHKQLNLQTEESVVRNLTNEFLKKEDREKYRDCVLIRKSSDGYELEDKFEKMLNTDKNFFQMVNELIQYGIENYLENYSESYKDTEFQLYQKYTYEDVCRLLNWQRNMNAQNIGGYFYDTTTKTLPVFINYDKAEDAIAYEDRFVTRENLIALSKHPRKINSSDADHFLKRTEADKENKILLFVRKNKDDKEAKEFYFLGEIFAQGEPIPIKMEKTGDDAFEINYRLDVPVREDIYEYIVSEA